MRKGKRASIEYKYEFLKCGVIHYTCPDPQILLYMVINSTSPFSIPNLSTFLEMCKFGGLNLLFEVSEVVGFGAGRNIGGELGKGWGELEGKRITYHGLSGSGS